jgi:predicted Rossmann fold flavoprotein
LEAEMKIAVIGAGPAGMAASIEAANHGAEVLLIDANPSPGRKLSATGSGRCNISNKHAEASRYHTSHPDQLPKIFDQFAHQQLLDWFDGLGIFTTVTDDGWIYPTSFSAQNVADILQAHLNSRKVTLIPHTLITSIQVHDKLFNLSTADMTNQIIADRVIIATGGPAAPQLGARDNMAAVLEKLGHTILPVKPALAPLLTDVKQFHKLQGVRLDAGIGLMKNRMEIGKTIGNIIFTSWGINGPGVIDLSYLVSQSETQNLMLELNFLPQPDQAQKLEILFSNLNNKDLPVSVLFKSFFPAKLVQYILEQNNIPTDKTISGLKADEIASIRNTIHHQMVQIKGIKGFKDSQLSTGGVPLSEISVASMQSRIVPGLSLAGEVLDVKGPCGGYNLHWAFASGIIAGRCITG